MRGRILHKYKTSYTIIISLGRDPLTGKRRQKWVSLKGTRKQAERKLTELLFQLDGGASLDPSKITLKTYLKMWLAEIKANVSPRTYERYEGIVINHIIPDLGDIPLDALKPQTLQQHYTESLRKGLQPRTVRYHHVVIHHALKTAMKRGMINHNVADAVDPPRFKKIEMQTWNMEELNKFLSSAQHHTLYALFYLALFTGMRRSELLGLQWQDVDLLGCQLSVRRAFHHLKDGTDIFTQPKSEKSRRTIALSPSTVAVLRAYKAQGTGKDNEQVFLNDGHYYNPNTVTWEWKKACIAAGVNPIRLHDARHTHASLMLKQGVHPKIVQERLGHSSIAITLDIYSHVVPGLQEAAARGFDEVIENKKASGFVAIPENS